jgi:phytoene dehydrogenase-like protein
VPNSSYDALIIGGGHNGLVCACYLAASGLRVRVVERRDVVGGAAVTEEFHPGFRNSTASYAVSLLHPKVIADLNLHARGLRIVERPLANFLPLPDGDYLKLGAGPEATRAEIARFSAADAARLAAYHDFLDRSAALLREMSLETPPNEGGGLVDALRALKLGARLRRLSRPARRDLLELMTGSAGDLLDDWFESEPLKAAFAFDAVVGTFASPYARGTAYVLLHHVFGEVNGNRGAWGHAIGGMGAITRAMAAEALARGVEISTGVGVARVRASGGAVRGVALEDGVELDAGVVVSNVNPRILYLDLMSAGDLDADLRDRIRRYECGSATFRMNVALSELPDFRCLPGREPAPHHGAGIYIAPSMRYMEQAYFDARADGWSRQPVIELTIPSTLDDSLAPAGAHVASLFCQHFNPRLPHGRSWDDVRDEAADCVVDTVDAYTTNFRSSVIARTVLTPLDLERDFGLVGGDIFHGQLSLGQLYSARPVLGHGDYRGPVRGLYMCGAGTHPGGGVSGLPGHNCAREIRRDLR